MLRMGTNVRLSLCGVIIVASAIYAVIAARNPGLATALATGYVAVLLSIFIIVNVWKKP